jgi:hypothetical protein
MEMWDQDYVDEEVPGHVTFGEKGGGEFQGSPALSVLPRWQGVQQALETAYDSWNEAGTN